MQQRVSTLFTAQRGTIGSISQRSLFSAVSATSSGLAHRSISSSSSSSSLLAPAASSSKKLAVAASVATIVGGAAWYSTSSVHAAAASSSSAPPTSAPSLPPFNLSNHTNYKSLADFRTNSDIVLYQYQTCPFCNKVRAALDYNGIKYRTIEVNPMTKEEKKVTPQLAAIKEVPVLVIDGHILTDSTPIVRHLHEIMNHYLSASEKHTITKEEEDGLAFVDKRVVILTAPNIYRTFSESIRSFDYISQNSQLSQSTSALKLAATKYVGAVAMYLIAERKLKKKYNITDPRKQLYQALDEWMKGNGSSPYRGGAKPNLADITCFGVMRSLQQYDTGRDIMNPENTSQEFIQWYKRMEQQVEGAQGSK